MTEITQEGWKNKALSMLLAQLTSYVLFIAATVIPSPGTVPIIPLIIAALTLAAFVVFWPFRGSILDRIVTLVFGAISLIFVIVPFPTSEVPPDQTAADGSVLPWYSWALAMGLLLVVLVLGLLLMFCPFCADVQWAEGIFQVKAGALGITFPVFQYPKPEPLPAPENPEPPRGFGKVKAKFAAWRAERKRKKAEEKARKKAAAAAAKANKPAQPRKKAKITLEMMAA